MYNKRISNIVVPMMGIGQTRGYAGLCGAMQVRVCQDTGGGIHGQGLARAVSVLQAPMNFHQGVPS